MKVPAIDGYTPPFGTKITRTDINRGGLSTREVTENVLMPFARMRPTVVTEDSSTGDIEYDAKIAFSAAGSAPSSGFTLTLGNGAYVGCTVTFTNLLSSYACTVMQADGTTALFSVPAGETLMAVWNGNVWSRTFDSRTFDQCHPVGEIYVQFPGQKNPTELYGSSGSTWTDITSTYAGLFFRAAGTVSGTDNASGSFNSSGVTVQNEGLPNITGQLTPVCTFRGSVNDYTHTDAFSDSTHYDNYGNQGGSGKSQRINLMFDASDSNSIYGSSSHVTPANTAIKIWKRTA